MVKKKENYATRVIRDLKLYEQTVVQESGETQTFTSTEGFYERLQSKLDRYEQLIDLDEFFAEHREIIELRRESCKKIRQFLACDEVLFYEYNEKESSFTYEYTLERKRYRKKTPYHAKSLAGECLEHQHLIHITEASQDVRSQKVKKQVASLKKISALVCVPVAEKGRPLGVLKFISQAKKRFSHVDLHFMKLMARKFTLAYAKAQTTEKLNQQFFGVCEALSDAILYKDRYTGGHAKRVAHFATMIGRELNLSSAELRDLRLSACFHDIGKIGIDDHILKKQGQLTPEEYTEMMNHPQIGYKLLSQIEGFERVLDGMRYHHEKYDGSGYPHGLRGEAIPLFAMVIAVADTFDAMISRRPYKKGLPPMVAYHEIIKQVGVQFSPRVVEAFIAGFRKTKMYKISEDQELQQKKAA